MSMEPVAFPTHSRNLFRPPDELDELRTKAPICPMRYVNGDEGWLVTSHALAKAVLTDSRFGRADLPMRRGRSHVGDPERLAEYEAASDAYGDWWPLRGFIFMDPPEHKRFRRLVAPYFTARRISTFRPELEKIVTRLLDDVERAGAPADLVSLFAAPLSLQSQCGYLGIPSSKVNRFYTLSTGISDANLTADAVVAAWREAWEYIRELADLRQREPLDDVVSAIAAERELTLDERADTAFSLFQGGLEATGDMMALSVFAVLCHPGQRQLLQQDPALISGAVEELLRFMSINQTGVGSTALEDVELDGTHVSKGETVTLSFSSANRDPARFDRPDDFDVSRRAVGHLTFSQGIHMCLGQHLARLELQVGLRGLLERFPTVALTEESNDVPVFDDVTGSYRIRELLVTW